MPRELPIQRTPNKAFLMIITSKIWPPLVRRRRITRLAHLASDEKLGDMPSCTLHIVSLDKNPRYKALSYVWGDLEVTTPICLRSMHPRSTIYTETRHRLTDSHYSIHKIHGLMSWNLPLQPTGILYSFGASSMITS